MATRPVFYLDKNNKVISKDIDFEWFAGFSISQKQKSIFDLHNNIASMCNCELFHILEISTKSLNPIGVKLSAFNLMNTINGVSASVEMFFQSSKVFQYGGPYTELLKTNSRFAKKDERINDSGKLVSFRLFGEDWSTEPKTFFYDWLYINAVYNNKKLHYAILQYEYFTDIEFNPKKSINCQAKSAAFYLSLYRRNILKKVVEDKAYYVQLFKSEMYNQVQLF